MRRKAEEMVWERVNETEERRDSRLEQIQAGVFTGFHVNKRHWDCS